MNTKVRTTLKTVAHKMSPFFRERESEKGQVLVFVALAIVGLLAIGSLAIDGGKLWDTRRSDQMQSDQACLAAAIASQLGSYSIPAAIESLINNSVDLSRAGVVADPAGSYWVNGSLYFVINEGLGTNLSKGIETGGGSIRTALWGESTSWLSHFAGQGTLYMGAQAQCEKGLGGVLPLGVKEWEDGSKIIQTQDDPNDYWEGACLDQSEANANTQPQFRDPPNCWVWGDWQVLAGDGHVPNEGGMSMNGLVAPDVRCLGAPGETNRCTQKVYLPPAPEGVQVNTLKSITMGYICGGYDSNILPIPGNYEGLTSANLAQSEGVSNKMLTQEIDRCYDIGDYVIVFVYASGRLWDGNKNFDYVEVIGFAVVEIVFIDANTVAVVPVFPERNEGDPLSLRDDLPQTLEEIEEAGFELYPHLIRWED